MALIPGARLGPYEIVAPISAGGMGEVYRARDTRLERTVAVKVLPDAMASRVQGAGLQDSRLLDSFALRLGGVGRRRQRDR